MAGALLGLLVGGVWFYRTQEQLIHQETENELSAIAQLKVNQIAAWREDELDDAEVLMRNSLFADGIARWLENPSEKEAEEIRTFFRDLHEYHDYQDVLLVDPTGQVRLSLNSLFSALHPDALQALATALRDRKPVFTDLHTGGAEFAPHISVVVPLLTENEVNWQPVGAIVLIIDAEQFLYPLVQFWPTPSETSETLLIRREGDGVLFLNELRHQQDTALQLRIPLSRTDLPAVMAVQGTQGIVQGRDYRGVDVIAVVQPIPDSPWFMVAKVDSDEAFATWQFLSAMIFTLLLGLVALIFVIWLVIWQRSQKRHFRALYQSETARRTGEARYGIILNSIADAVISTDAQGRVELMNPVAQALTGWTYAEARGKPLDQIFVIVNEETRQQVENPVAKTLRENKVVGMANNTLLIAKDGTEYPIADSGAPIVNEQGDTTGVVLVFRDQTKERAAQRALRESEASLRESQRVAHIGHWTWDTVSNTVFWSDEMKRIFGLDPVEFTGDLDRIISEAIHPDDREKVFEANTRVLTEQKPGLIEYRIVRPDGSVRTISAVPGDSETDDNGYIVKLSGIVQDITVRTQMEEALRESEARFRRAVEEAPLPIAIHAEDGQFLSISRAWFDITGYEPGEVPTIADWAERAYGARREEVEAGINALYELDRQVNEGEFVITCKDGSQRIWEFSTTPLGRLLDGRRTVISMAADVTERKAAEEALRESQAILQAAMDQSLAGIAIADVPDGSLRYVNNAGLLIRGEKREAIVSGVGLDQYVSIWQILDLDGTPLKTEEVPLARAVMFGENCSREFIVRRSDNDDRVVLANAGPILDEHGTQIAAIVVFLDITEQKRLETENKRLAAQFYQSQKMESIGQLAGGIAHDFNNLLVPIMGYAELGMIHLTEHEKLYENFKQIKKSADRAAQLTRQILAFSRRQVLEMRVLDLNEVIFEFRKMMQRIIGEDIVLQILSAPMLARIKADAGQIEQILLNLVVNARDAMRHGGKLTIETANVVLDEDYTSKHIDTRPGRYVMLAVTDTGDGMDAETQEHIFEPFYTTKPQGHGTGLGLATVFGIVKQHGGNIWVYSEPGYGSTFKVYLPVAEIKDKSWTGTPEDISDLRGTETVLVVEDEPGVRQLVCDTLLENGYQVLQASNPDEVISLAEDHLAKIDMLLTDVIMPGMNGRQLYENLVRHHPNLKVLYMSGYTDNVIVHHGVLNDGTAFLQKPFTLGNLLRKVRTVLS
jgi:PAS domain S-box-containing protein